MNEFFATLESSGLATWVRESTSVWAYPTILTLHTVGLGIVVGAGVVLDFRILGKSKAIPIRTLDPLFTISWLAFALNFVTGLLLFIADAVHKAGQRVFHIKLILIAIALICLVRIRRAIIQETERGEPQDLSASLKGLAILSLLLWTGAIVAGRLMAYL